MNKLAFRLIFVILIAVTGYANATSKSTPIPATGISGVYEVMIGTKEPKPLLLFLEQFGFTQVKKASLSAEQSLKKYGVNSKLTSYRLQNGDIDSHGLIRVLHWESILDEGVGYAQPETIGQRMMVMRTTDIFRLHDIFSDARESGEKWFPTLPVYDDLYDMTEGKLGVINRRVGVREMATYGALVNIVFYQRYGYTIPGYGSIGAHSPLATSEITHNDFIIGGHSEADMYAQTNYYRDVLGFKPEGPVVLDGDWQAGPKAVFNMADGASHFYRGFVSPNNISGKLKFFVNPDVRPDRSNKQRIGSAGITLHSVYTTQLSLVHQLAKSHNLNPTILFKNEFDEQGFVFVGHDGSTWQVIEKPEVKKEPLLKLNFVKK